MPLDDRKALARTLTSLMFDIGNPDHNIRESLDEPVEQVTTTNFYNGPAAEWVQRKTDFRWMKLDYDELDKVQTVRDLGKICFAHLIQNSPSLSQLPDDVLGGEDD